MVILISPENNIEHEHDILSQLFQVGLEYYHLRKPFLTHKQLAVYLKGVDEKHHSKIVLHQGHELINDFNLRGVHFKEQMRKDSDSLLIEKYIERKELIVSSSFHQPEVLEECHYKFDYNFLSPVFTSISKLGYQGKEFDVKHIDKQIIGMGGITVNNLNKVKEMGYDGVGVLGSVWQSESPVATIKQMLEYFQYTK